MGPNAGIPMKPLPMLLLSTILLLSGVVARAQCVPRDDQAAFAVDPNFRGTCIVLGVGDYPTATSTHLPNDSISSIRVGANIQVYACRDENFSGACTLLHGSHANLTGDPVGDNAITSIKVQGLGTPLPCDPGPLRVAFYVDPQFLGACKMLAIGDYPTATSTGLPNDSVSSIRVGPGAQVMVCVDEYYGGNCSLVTSDIPNMNATTVGDDHLTSAKVRQLGTTDFDPRCSDAHATGRFSCRIDQPDVTHAEKVYSNVAFALNDTVYVDGDGCVQTGSHLWSGSTWKRLVNPSGRNSDHLYHGLVRIPGGLLLGTDVGNTLTRIEHVVGRPIKVTDTGVAANQLVLHLGYEDDDLSDNSYNEHDDGTEDQCKTESGNDGGPAHVTITICRGVAQCEAPASRFPFNVRSEDFDVNGFLYNPHWSWQERHGNEGKWPNVAVCHYMTKSTLSAAGIYAEPNLPDCSDQAGADTLNLPPDASANNIACTVGSSAPGEVVHLGHGGFSGHINWFPVTLEGNAGPPEENIDDDWSTSFRYEGTGGSLYYGQIVDPRHYVHSEFDSDETTKNFHSSAWEAVKTVVAAGDTDTLKKDFAGHAIVTGLFGIDGEHGEKSEIHPVYAFASNPCVNSEFDSDNDRCFIANPVSDDAWLIFVRNRGDEGFCSGDVWSGGFDDYTFRLPWRDGMQSATVDWDKTQFEWSDDTSTRPDVKIVPPRFVNTIGVSRSDTRTKPPFFEAAGIYVTFHLHESSVISASDSSASIPFVDGALHLVWTPTDASSPRDLRRTHTEIGPARAGNRADLKEDQDEEKDNLEIALRNLPEADRKKVLQARTHASPANHAQLPTESANESGTKRAPREVLAGNHSPVAGPVGPAERKNVRDAALIKALCEASHGKPFGLPAAICSTDAEREHR
jgi:hypothetical protein